MKNRLSTILRFPFLAKSNKPRYCLCCFEKFTEPNNTLFCDNCKSHKKSYPKINTNQMLRFLELMLEKWGFIFALQNEKQVSYFKKDLQDIMQKVEDENNSMEKEVNDENGY